MDVFLHVVALIVLERGLDGVFVSTSTLDLEDSFRLPR